MSSPLNPLTTNLSMTQVTVDPSILGNLPVYANWEYTNGSVASAYAANIQAFVSIFNLGSTVVRDSNGNVTSVTPHALNSSNPDDVALANAVIAAIFGNPPSVPTAVTSIPADTANLTQVLTAKGLLGLSQTMVENPPGSLKFYGLTVSMANNLDQLLRSLQAVGWDGTQGNLLQTDANGNYLVLNKWRDMSITSPTIQGILTGAVGAVTTNRSLQSSIETVYVATANDLISNKLSDLEQQLSNSQDVLDTLSSIQNIHNNIVVSGKGSINFVYNVSFYGGNDKFADAYAAAASAHFGQPIIPHVPSSLVTYGTPPLTGTLAVIASQQNTLKQEIDDNLKIMTDQVNALQVLNQTYDGKTVEQIVSEYYQAAKDYQLAIDAPGDVPPAQVIQLQQTYLLSANEYNKVLWALRIWPSQDVNNTGTTLPSTVYNPASPLKTFQSNVLNFTLITNPFTVPPTTRAATTADYDQVGLSFGNLATYINRTITAWNNVIKDNYNSIIDQLNAKVDALNTVVQNYNDSNPTLPQLTKSDHINKFENANGDWGNNLGQTSPVVDGSNYIHPYVSNPPPVLDGNTFAHYLDQLYGGSGNTHNGAGVAYPGNPYQGNPFSSTPTVFGDAAGEDFKNQVTGATAFLSSDRLNFNATLPTFNHTENNHAAITNPVKAFGYYDKEGRPILTPTSLTSQGNQVLSELLVQRSKVLSEITYLETVTPKIQTANGLTFDPNSLVVKLRKVITDMNNTLTDGTGTGVALTRTSTSTAKLNAFVNWIMDNYDKTDDTSASKQGQIQQSITFAITAAQSSNDSQKTKVQQFMFIFEEYYKSAAAILTKITEIIEKIAQGIAR